MTIDDDLAACVRAAHVATDRDGWAVLMTPVRATSPQDAALAERLAELIGTPTPTTPTSPVIAWPITPAATTARMTFSQTTDEAEFHTDTQYYDQPERYFALFCVHADVPGNGTNRLVDTRPLLAALDPGTLAVLRRPYPFRVPSIFTADGSDAAVEVTWQPIFDGATVRWRQDTLRDALALPGVRIDARQRAAVEIFADALAHAPVIEHHLQPGEALLVDNHRMVHARTPFTDTRRFLYRVRMHAR